MRRTFCRFFLYILHIKHREICRGSGVEYIFLIDFDHVKHKEIEGVMLNMYMNMNMYILQILIFTLNIKHRE